MKILGISAFYHDSAAAIVEDGHIVAAAQEERFTRIKHDPAFPARAARYCLEAAGCGADELDYVVFYEKPFLKFERLLETYLAVAPKGFSSFRHAMPLWIKEKLFQKRMLTSELKKLPGASGWNGRLLFTEHHQSHAASAFYPSPFNRAAVLTLDGVGEWCTTSLGVGNGRSLEIVKEIRFPHSLGLLYSAFTYFTGFKVNSGEYKLMGLAPYGEPKYVQKILDHLIDLREDGSFHLDQRYFNYVSGLRMTSKRFAEVFGGRERSPDEPLTQHHMDLAASIQKVTEIAVLRLARTARKETGERNLCLAGGVALNCVANGVLHREGVFDEIWVQPAAGDAGGSLGAALYAWNMMRPEGVGEGANGSGVGDAMRGAYLGPEYAQPEIERRLTQAGARFKTGSRDEITAQTADALGEGKAVGWMQGRMEFGPRALGNRSILGDPRSPTMQKLLNLKVKYRESFRPFAPSVLREDVAQWFQFDRDSPYMLMCADIVPERRRQMTSDEAALFGIEKLNISRSEIPAVTHVDYSARLQTVHRDTNPRYWELIDAFKQRTGCPVVVNTSFNVRGEPIVESPDDAFRCFMGTDIERLVIGNCILKKEEQDPALAQDYKNAFAPD